MVVIVAVTAAAAFTVLVVMIVLAVYVTVRQFFCGRFADRDNFHVEVQVLAGQHVVAVNHNVVAVNFSDFNRYRALIGVSQETHADLQFVNAHEDVFRYALHQVFVVVAVRVVRADVNVASLLLRASLRISTYAHAAANTRKYFNERKHANTHEQKHV